MNDGVRNLLLVLCGLSAFILLIVAYIWYFVFGRSLRRVFMAGLTIFLNRDMKTDINAPLNITKRPEAVKGELKTRASTVNFDSAMSSHDKYVPYIAGDDDTEFSAEAAEQESKSFVISSVEASRFRRIAQVVTYPFLGLRWQPKNTTPNQNVNRGSDTPDPSIKE